MSSNFGSLTGPGLGMHMRTGMPRLSMGRGRGLGVPSLGGLGIMKLAIGGAVNHPSMSWLSVRDTLRGMPNHTVPDYMLARMADGGNVSVAAGRRAMRAGYLPHAAGFPHMADGGGVDPMLDYAQRGMRDVDGAYADLGQTITRRRPMGQMPSPGQRSPSAEFSNRGRIDQDLLNLIQQRDRESDVGGGSIDPSDLPMMMANPRRVPMKAFLASMALPESLGDMAGTALSGPAMGGLSALLHAKNAGADAVDEMPRERNSMSYDKRRFKSYWDQLLNSRP